jgi:DNA-binding winged helix-turn-helix (wHTH) protein
MLKLMTQDDSSLVPERSTRPRRSLSARISASAAALEELLSVSGSQSDFVLASSDGSTRLRIDLAVSSVPDAEVVIGGGVVLDWSRATISRDDNRTTLTQMELLLLLALLEFAPKAAPREHLIRRLWPQDAVGQPDKNAALPVWVLALRRRLAAIGLPDAIRTVRGKGYCLQLAQSSRQSGSDPES